jgi:hypothetical protein
MFNDEKPETFNNVLFNVVTPDIFNDGTITTLSSLSFNVVNPYTFMMIVM